MVDSTKWYRYLKLTPWRAASLLMSASAISKASARNDMVQQLFFKHHAQGHKTAFALRGLIYQLVKQAHRRRSSQSSPCSFWWRAYP